MEPIERENGIMYKDKDKQREAQRNWVRQKRAVKGSTEQGSTVTKADSHVDASDIGMVKALHQAILKPERIAQDNIRVSKPGDPDYEPQCETTRAFIEGRPKRPETGKRGKDIKCFTDLPADVQNTIDRMSTIDGELDQDIKAKRTAAAIKYQHLFPDRYHSIGAAHA